MEIKIKDLLIICEGQAKENVGLTRSQGQCFLILRSQQESDFENWELQTSAIVRLANSITDLWPS